MFLKNSKKTYYNRAKLLFLAYQTGALHNLESFASLRSFSNKVKIKNTKTNFHAQVQMCVFLKNLWFLTSKCGCPSFFLEK